MEGSIKGDTVKYVHSTFVVLFLSCTALPPSAFLSPYRMLLVLHDWRDRL